MKTGDSENGTPAVEKMGENSRKDGTPPPPSLPLDTIGRVYALAIEGKDASEIGRVLGFDRKTAEKHLARLVAAQVLVAQGGGKGRGRARKYERGPRSPIFESVRWKPQGAVGGTPEPLWDVHHFRVSWRYVSGPSKEPVWEKGAQSSGVASVWLHVERHGLRWQVRDYKGKEKRSIEVRPVEGLGRVPAEAIVARELEALGWASDVIEAFAADYGYLLVGRAEIKGPRDYALPLGEGVPLVAAGVAGVSPVHIDTTPGPGPTIETHSVEVAAAVSRLPETEERVALAVAKAGAAEARSAAVEVEVDRLHGIVAKVIDLLGSTVKDSQAMAEAIVAMRTPQEPPPSDPPKKERRRDEWPTEVA
jgi:hypothetical protein